jgi:hypothetical protein
VADILLLEFGLEAQTFSAQTRVRVIFQVAQWLFLEDRGFNLQAEGRLKTGGSLGLRDFGNVVIQAQFVTG